MSLLPDPVADIVEIFFKRAAQTKFVQYATLILELSIAGTISFLGGCGLSLVCGRSVPLSIGSGMLFSALALLATFGKSANSKGLIISIPDDIQKKAGEIPTDTTYRNFTEKK